MSKRITASAAVALLVGISVLQPVAANATTSITSVSASVSDSGFRFSALNVRFAETLSTSYKVRITADDVMKLKVEYNLGYREIGMIYTTATASRIPADKIIALRQQKLGWGEIAKIYGVKVSDLKRRNYDVLEKSRIVVTNEPEDYDYIKIVEYREKDYDKDDHHPKNDKHDKHDKQDKHEKKHGKGN